jgi:thiamine-phosphate pyrophosphorylase
MLLYYITDRTQFPGDDTTRRSTLLKKIGEAARAEVDYVQLREKDLQARELELLAAEAVRVIRESSELRTENQEPRTRLLINSRTDVALAASTDGVHFRGDDISAADARSVWAQVLTRSPEFAARRPIIAISCHTPVDVIRAGSQGADFAVFGPVFEKEGTLATGIDALREACKGMLPVLALGGVTLQNTRVCLEAGAAGIAAIRLFQENEIEDVVRALRRL